jgi:hypothetical protein
LAAGQPLDQLGSREPAVVSLPKWDQLGYRFASNGDDDLLPGCDTPEEPSSVIAQVP